ncbi:hypothetical protein [Leeia sp.]|uniref:hypothetical protein n=1 Tax=Leeia sp. TaxID=2884678 RepID=UPI0035AEAA38
MMRRSLLAALLLLTSLGSLAHRPCPSPTLFQPQVKQHFEQGQLTALLDRAQPVTVVLDNEYDEQTPRRRLHFSPAEARRWLDAQLSGSETRLVPEQVRCNQRGCRYTAPELTVHHAVYLLGWQYTAGRCPRLNLVHLMLG